ncbi:MAG: GAF and ANTAR domain-containing protein [Jatrophihabitantaceae bacterium]
MSGPTLPADDAEQPAAGPATGDLAASYQELQNLLLDSEDLTQFLHQVAVVAAGLVGGSSCGITLRRELGMMTVANSDAFALRVDEIQYGHGQGPCLEAMEINQEVHVPDMSAETRWGDYRLYAIAHGVRASLSFPLIVGGAVCGALNLYNRRPKVFDADHAALARAFARQAAMALTLVLRRADEIELQAQMRHALAGRSVIDQALGILMGSRGITAAEAFGVLREVSHNSNRAMAAVAADLIESFTGRPPSPPRLFT